MGSSEEYGFKVRFDHKFPEKWTQHHRPSLFQIYNMIGTIVRYIIYSIYTLVQGKKPIMNFFSPVEPQQRYGVPIGGIGGGSINRGWRGEFCRYQLVPGMYEYETLWANQFILTVHSQGTGELLYQQVLSPHPPPPGGALSAWAWQFPAAQGSYRGLYPRAWYRYAVPQLGLTLVCAQVSPVLPRNYKFPAAHGSYRGLYPRAWYRYAVPQLGLTLVCAQVSPVLPRNYKDSSIPGVVFRWYLENSSRAVYEVALAFTWQNGRGHSQDGQGGASSAPFKTESIQGVHIRDRMNGMDQAFTLSASRTENVSICPYFNPKGNGAEIWDPLRQFGSLSGGGTDPKSPPVSKVTERGETLGVGLCVKQTLGPGGSSSIDMSLVWTMNQVQFRNRTRKHERYYTKWFPGTNLEAAEGMSEYALEHYADWNQAIEEWQKPTLQDTSLPDWYKSCVFNELYFISDGGTVWFKHEDEKSLDSEDPRKEVGRFAYLEGHEYRMINTYDVHFYASFSLASLWPRLEQSLQHDFRDAVYQSLPQSRWLIHSGHWVARKYPLSVPHDLGDPEEEPWSLINAYNIYDVSDWKDLNLKFIISVYRDHASNPDLRFLRRMYPAALDLIRKCDRFDRAGLGIIQNGGFPDQTFDCWTMTGVSAYCGGLHIAALACVREMSSLLGDTSSHQEFSAKLTKASQVYHDMLWTGDYYKFDSSDSSHSKSIMADQLCGFTYLKACGISTEAIFPTPNIHKALDTIFRHNVRGFQQGRMGAVNGMNPDGTLDTFAIQSEEVWTGVTYLLAATMLYEGRHEEAWVTAGGLYRTVYERIGLGYETPEGLTGDNTYRAGGYMRALAVYSMQHALRTGKR